MSVSGIINTHFIVAHMIARHGTGEQKDYFLPRMAAGEVRGAFSMSEPGLGSDVAAIRTRAVRDGDDFVINGQKMWLTNGGTANLVAVLCHTDEGHDAPHRNMTTFLIEKEPGFGPNPAVPGLTVPGKIEKMGYKGVDTTELILEDVRVPAARVLGGGTGRGFYQMMDASRSAGSTSPPAAAASHCAPSSWPSPTRSSGTPSASRSPSTRRSPSSWPRWPPRSRRPTR